MSNKFHFPIILLLILFAFFLGLYGAKFGLDVTDTGFFLYSQYRLLNGGMVEESALHLTMGSDWIGALWIHYVADNSLYIAKVGSLFLRFLVLAFVYMSVSNILKNKIYSAYLTIFSYFAFSSVFGFMIINYDLAPLLPISIIMWLLSIVINWIIIGYFYVNAITSCFDIYFIHYIFTSNKKICNEWRYIFYNNWFLCSNIDCSDHSDIKCCISTANSNLIGDGE